MSLRGSAPIDTKPLLDWVDRHPEAVKNWASKKAGKQASVMRALTRARSGENLSFVHVDEICCLLGVHMSEIYGDLYWTAPIHSPTCRNGHPYEGDNLVYNVYGHRVCRACKNAYQRRRRARAREKYAAERQAEAA